ncbi:Universal stress protein family [Pediococcus damnosus]|uniref:Universal stress protein family n=1 Tax=Pediococcus damnosus TaxID=51663 RepID=A0A0R2HL91_9LACO|nr:universal stress protein [Pediococcus damnosus]AMV63321.1 Universal stress protein family [Pediococcus damnosus]AMV66779.1 Universal stress protein family [Pediococcus damnosus]AMV69858.1 Universal stress protein family [Pediococcus damnosus]KJU73513.1 universal stress protein UspA [Pediococcus damnosus LMG 28219]KRN53448.1 universal stress protein UspA-like nucleotide-binding protein [Pediococcus damnosus]
MSESHFDPKHFSKILVGVDDSPDAQLAFRFAMNRAKQDNAELDIVSILEEDEINIYQALNKDYIQNKRDDLEKHLQGYRKVAEEFGIKKVETYTAEGDAGETIVKDVIPHVEPDLLVIGSSSRSGVARYFGSQASYMAKYSPVSVLVIR